MADVELSFGRGHLKHLNRDHLESFLQRLDDEWAKGLDGALAIDDGFRDRLMRDYGAGFHGLLMVHSGVLEAVNWAAAAIEKASADDDDRDALVAYFDVIKGLTARGLQAFDEVTWLLRGGYPNGAFVRARTLHELYITAGVLASFGRPDGTHPELVDRYLRHHEVFTRSTAQGLMSTGMLDPTMFFDEQTLSRLDAQREELLARYGRSFSTMWGWAAPLFSKGERISMDRLGELIDPGLNFFYGMTSAHVHAGSQGWHESFVERGDERLMPAGPTNLGFLVPAQLATTFLTGLVQFAVPAVIEKDGVRDDTGAMLMAGIDHLRERAMTGLVEGDEVVVEAERNHQSNGEPPGK